jgi:hypothetical protein
MKIVPLPDNQMLEGKHGPFSLAVGEVISTAKRVFKNVLK